MQTVGYDGSQFPRAEIVGLNVVAEVYRIALLAGLCVVDGIRFCDGLMAPR